MTVRKRVERAIGLVFGAWVLIAFCLQTWGVLSRNILSWSTAWIDDIQRFNFIWLIWILAAIAYGTRGLIRLDLLQAGLVSRPRAYHAVSLGIALVELVFSVSFVLLGSRIVATQLASGETTVSIGIPLWTLTAGFVLGCALFTVFAVRNVARETRRLVTNAVVVHEREIAQEVEDAVDPEATGGTGPEKGMA